jgi:diguanylate cyclase (GGDEF)-like protein
VKPKRDLVDGARRLLSPVYGARANAAQALEEMTDARGRALVHGSDLALLVGHPSGQSQRRVAGRLGTALWEVFPAQVALLDRDGVVVSVNRAWRDFGLANGAHPTTGLGSNYLELCRRAAEDGEPEAAQAADIVAAALTGSEPQRRLDYPLTQDELRWSRLQAIPLPGAHSGALVIHYDITADRHRQQEWRHRALNDPLTGLPNRALLCDRLEHAAAARDGHALGVLFVGLNGFKQVNDRFGQEGGDQVLREVARRFQRSVRPGDTVGRWGGDEFLAITERLDGAETIGRIAARLQHSLVEPVAVGAASLSVTATIGSARAGNGRSATQLVNIADQDLQAKRGRPPTRSRERGSAWR